MRNDCEISSVRKYAAEECYALRSTEIINFVRMEEWYFFFLWRASVRRCRLLGMKGESGTKMHVVPGLGAPQLPAR